MPAENKGLFITGTDTGVGKTFVAAGLARCLKDRGLAPGVLKPVETGCALRKGKRIPRDGSFLKHMAGATEPIEEIVPYRLAAPLAPQVAAEKEGVRIQTRRIHRAFREISSRHPCTLVEGAGGILVPVTRSTTMVDLMEQFKLPVLLVSRIGLGTLNHTLLSLFYLAQHKIPVAGIVLNDPDGCRDLSARSNPATLRQWCSVPILGDIPYRKGIRMSRGCGDEIAGRVDRYVEVDAIVRQMCRFDPLVKMLGARAVKATAACRMARRAHRRRQQSLHVALSHREDAQTPSRAAKSRRRHSQSSSYDRVNHKM